MALYKLKFKYLNTWLKLKIKYLNSWFLPKHTDYTKFIILCSPRTGSTLLHTYLNSHPNIYSHGEVLRRKPLSRNHLQSSIFKAYGSNIKSVGLKVFYQYAYQEEFKGAYEQLAYDENIKVIHIVREDIKSQYLSFKNAFETEHWNSANGKQFDYSDEIDPKELGSFISQIDRDRSACINHFQNHTSMVVSYEKLTEQTNEVLLNIQRFLYVEPSQLSTLLIKISKN